MGKTQKTKNKHILFTGGGTAGHVTPNIALIEKLYARGWKVSYIGSKNGIEKELISRLDAELKGGGIDYFSIATGKLRRYFSFENFLDPFKILLGICQAVWLCCRLKPKVIFSKGGFVSFPVVVAGWICRIPIILHESDLTPGLANKLSYPFASKICVAFPDSLKYFETGRGKEQKKSENKIIVTGTPIREALFLGDAAKGLALCGFNRNKKVILVFGGSLGAERINQVLRQALPELIKDFQIAHVCGKGKIDDGYQYSEYKQFSYLDKEFPDIIAAADVVIARSGANAAYELLALKKPHIFIPLTKRSSRGDQIDNALYFAKLGVSEVIMEEDLAKEKLIAKVNDVVQNSVDIIYKLKQLDLQNGAERICNLIEDIA